MESIPANVDDARAELEQITQTLGEIEQARQQVAPLRERAGFLNGFIIALDAVSAGTAAATPMPPIVE